MAGLFWIFMFLSVAGCHQSSPSHVPHDPLVVVRGQNVSLTCNITSSSDITWYLLSSDRLLPLLSVSESKLKNKKDIINPYSSRIAWTGDLSSGLIRLEIQAVEEQDAGLYFCSGLCEAKVCVSRGIPLKLNGVDGDAAGRKTRQPCWSLGICVLPGLLGLCSFLMIGLYLCSGKLGLCCCNPRRQHSLRITEDDSLHYSSLRHPDKSRPSVKSRPRLAEDLVTYSTVTTRKNLNG
ncbi:uncharacterized protein LOC122844150 isoform X2 [Gambusia affinis]|uniref:uncharacterized protein LOC122844150 isoform X2 n=1 Tax=Gambusia affinis TaxID=33528 RepID=UPI001CDD8E3B|nr:uncharacterized protein LOC122844150 isoform X2 [Gambusia affinis]